MGRKSSLLPPAVVPARIGRATARSANAKDGLNETWLRYPGFDCYRGFRQAVVLVRLITLLGVMHFTDYPC
jgi:hypothetical protein